MSKVDWSSFIDTWQPSQGASPVTDPTRVKQIADFCKFVGANLWDRIEYFDNPLASKQQIERDRISKNEVFESASDQLSIHGKVWEVVQAKFPDRLTYEFPLAVNIDGRLRYMKFQIGEGVKGLASPSKVKKVWLRYHISDQEIEVKYVAK